MPDRVADAALSSHSRAFSCASWAERLASTRAWARALAFSLVAWGALLGAVFGSSAGVVTHTLTAKQAVSLLHLQRQAGTSSATRSARRDQAQLSATSQLEAASLYTTALDDTVGDVSAQGLALRADDRRAQAPTGAAAEPPPKRRYSAPPSRAPPALA